MWLLCGSKASIPTVEHICVGCTRTQFNVISHANEYLHVAGTMCQRCQCIQTLTVYYEIFEL